MLQRQAGLTELMDLRDAPPRMLARSLADMRRVNRLFGWHRPVMRAVQSLFASSGHCTVLDVAAGSGDLSLAMARGLPRPCRSVRVIAADVHPTVLAVGQRHTSRTQRIYWVGLNAALLPFPRGSVDVVTCASALHHFDDRDAVSLLAALAGAARCGVVVTDASRSRLSLATVSVLSRFSRSPLTWHDGPVSVRRAYTADEAVNLARSAGWRHMQIQRLGPFRWMLIGRTSPPCFRRAR
ncbi:MAG: hypothetical protein CL878_04710 [Dehalococcoidia bacterium]|nr:hypothetical protein [Dehalococcoidia bacterium]